MKQHSKLSLPILLFIAIFIQLATLQVAIGQSKTAKLDELMNLYTEYGQFNGSVLVAQKGKVIYKKGFGMANMEWEIPKSEKQI